MSQFEFLRPSLPINSIIRGTEILVKFKNPLCEFPLHWILHVSYAPGGYMRGEFPGSRLSYQ